MTDSPVAQLAADIEATIAELRRGRQSPSGSILSHDDARERLERLCTRAESYEADRLLVCIDGIDWRTYVQEELLRARAAEAA